MQISLWSGGPTFELADRWQPLRTMPDDPPDTRVFGFTLNDGAKGFLMMHSIPPGAAMPLDQQAVIAGLRGADEVRAGEAGLIGVDAGHTTSGVPYVYSLMKIPGDPRGVHYNLTLHLIGERTLQIRGHFDEGDLTGTREAIVYEMAQRHNMLHEPTAGDPTGGWAHDPFDHSTTGFVMNMSELPDFDEQFPSHPLTMTRELLRNIADS
ncbi:hypothetical protein [Mycobacterium sp. 29Ha]|uniref:hypothetical protein n=1 Tax=Mycobacterium sp. 29Ha TaxID=2939268 RepID=UPI0029395318|nr:hypothetical protein [Mycobacterium sp. 29Ha]MDV3136669.1 hypothetical protein [Mycobacterium sp. 29Ha]